MSLKSTKSESGVFWGCLVFALLGMLGGGIGGYWYISKSSMDLTGGQGLFSGMAIMIGCVIGGISGSILGAIVSALRSKKEKEEEEF